MVKAQAYPTHTTYQQAELIALTHVFQLAQGQSLHLNTNCNYAFHTLLSHTAIWKEHMLLTTKGGSVTNVEQIMPMLKAPHLPIAIGIVHCWSHQTGIYHLCTMAPIKSLSRPPPCPSRPPPRGSF